MPYTPPSQQSPASSKPTSPVLSRASSYSNENPYLRSPSSPRPNLPRSTSSTAYLQRSRRGPTARFDMASPISPDETKTGATHIENTLPANGSIRQSPPPLNNLLIPTGAIISPPDSSENSDGDEPASISRGTDVRKTWSELHEAVRSIELKREPSPGGMSLSESPIQTSDDSEDDELRTKPPLVRKKSGELVKPALRPSSRRRYSSMPGTPTYSKSVHFNDNGNQTRHFLQVDKPMAVSAGSSPVETYESETEYPFQDRTPGKVEWDIKLTNFPEDTHERRCQVIRVERIFLSADSKSLIGTVAVANLAFQKLVVARFTLDYWKTTSEIVADYNTDVRRQQPADGLDRFNFSIRLADQANLENKTLLLCIRYNVNGQDYWDNNNNMNYQIDFVKKHQPQSTGRSMPHSTLGARPLNAIPRSRHSYSGGNTPPNSNSRGRTPSIDDDFMSRFDNSSSAYHFGSPKQLIGESGLSPANSIKLKPRSKRSNLPAELTPPAKSLGGRYDFGASLSAALTSAQDSLGRESGLMGKKAPQSNSGYFNHEVTKQKPTTVAESPIAITTDRPAMGSDQYKDLVQKFCYFTPSTPGKVSPLATASGSQVSNTDGAQDNESVSDYSLGTGSSTPTPPQRSSPMLDGANDRFALSSSMSPFASRSASPAPVTGHDISSMSVSFGYPYRYNMRDGYLSDSVTPTAIRG
ncbi:hypothetical protein H2203_006317 [Taxawa tesnikishii (nom. ined.)]|nr:hypothetical protein H2203_006317 [Dothideales sp. JES 119]